MKVSGTSMRTIWLEPDGSSVGIIDQTQLPHELVTARLATLDEAAHAIRTMHVRGAPLIGATAAYGLALAMRDDASDDGARPTRARCCWRRGRPRSICAGRWSACAARCCNRRAERARATPACARAAAICDEDVAISRAIGEHGLDAASAPLRRRRSRARRSTS